MATGALASARTIFGAWRCAEPRSSARPSRSRSLRCVANRDEPSAEAQATTEAVPKTEPGLATLRARADYMPASEASSVIKKPMALGHIPPLQMFRLVLSAR